jgi:hypothetical protein
MSETYSPLPLDDILDILRIFEKSFARFIYIVFRKKVDYEISGLDLLDLVIRSHKRKQYFNYFHHGTKINEAKIAAIFVYWILKLKPFRITDAEFCKDMQFIDINELFSIHIIVDVLKKLGRISRKPLGDEDFFKTLRYSFRFRNISIDSMLILLESINNSSFFP